MKRFLIVLAVLFVLALAGVSAAQACVTSQLQRYSCQGSAARCWGGQYRTTPSNQLDVQASIYPMITPPTMSTGVSFSAWAMFASSGTSGNFVQVGYAYDYVQTCPNFFGAYQVNGVYHEWPQQGGDCGAHVFNVHRRSGTTTYDLQIDGATHWTVSGLPSANGQEQIFSEAYYPSENTYCGHYRWSFFNLTWLGNVFTSPIAPAGVHTWTQQSPATFHVADIETSLP